MWVRVGLRRVSVSWGDGEGTLPVFRYFVRQLRHPFLDARPADQLPRSRGFPDQRLLEPLQDVSSCFRVVEEDGLGDKDGAAVREEPLA